MLLFNLQKSKNEAWKLRRKNVKVLLQSGMKINCGETGMSYFVV